MDNPIVARALAGADQTKAADLAKGAVQRSGRAILEAMGDAPVLLVADENTWRVAGQAVHDSLQAAGATLTEPLVFPARPVLYASLDNAHAIAETLRRHDEQTGATVTPVAIGAGTLNDLVKLAAKDLGRRYAVVGTAASMDGYTGPGAPISDQGVKRTLDCVAPYLVVFDLDVAAAAPGWMTASGYGDLSAKIPAGADWIIAEAAGLDPVDQEAWELVQSGVRTALSRPDELAAGNPEAFQGLVDGLVLSGLAMQVYGGTRPASGAEHYFSHLWELEHLGAEADPPLSHGAKVAVGTLAMLTFYEEFLTRDLATLDLDAAVAAWPSWEQVEADIRSRFTGALAEHAVKETREKYLDVEGLRARLQRLVDDWPATRTRLEAQLVPAVEFQGMLRRSGAPSRPEDIGLTPERVRETYWRAMYYRSRYTVLDVAREAGWFDELVERTFQRHDVWG